MHIPGHILDLPTSLAAGAVSTAIVVYAKKRSNQEPKERMRTLLPVAAAGVFAAQMLNFPIANGTSGHLLGGALVGIILGPWAGMLAVTAVIVVQCVFHDGGLLALGANVLNMAIVGSGAGYLTYASIRRRVQGTGGQLLGAAIAGWASVVLSAALCSLELAVGGGFPLGKTLSAMMPAHAAIGAVEAAITLGAFAALLAFDPRLLYSSAQQEPFAVPRRKILVPGLGVALLVAVLLGPLASKQPDALQSSLQRLSGHASPVMGPTQ